MQISSSSCLWFSASCHAAVWWPDRLSFTGVLVTCPALACMRTPDAFHLSSPPSLTARHMEFQITFQNLWNLLDLWLTKVRTISQGCADRSNLWRKLRLMQRGTARRGEGENSSGKMATGFRAAIFGGSWNDPFCGNARARYLKMSQLVETCCNFSNLTLPRWFGRKFCRTRQLGACRKITTCWSNEDAWGVPNPDLTVGTTSNRSEVLKDSFQQCHVPTWAAFHR